MSTIEEIISFLERTHGIPRRRVTPDSDLCNDLGIDGDDFFELEEEIAREFGVDMTGYRWYFHHGEEGWNPGSLIYPAPYQMVDHIPVTPAILLEAVTTKRWPIVYPPHSLPERRRDIEFNCMFPYFLIAGLVVLGILLLAFF